jgi:Uma2 family endonuclease
MEKVKEYLTVGVPLIWVVEPVFRTVTVYRPGQEPELLNSRQELVGDPQLPGFRAPVAALFRK